MAEELELVFVTTYCLSLAKIEQRALSIDSEGYACDRKRGFQHFGPSEWFRNREDAVVDANRRREKKITSLKKQIAKLEKMTF